MEKLYSILSALPWVMISGNVRENGSSGNRRIQFNWPDFLRVVAVALLGAIASTIIMVNVLSVKLDSLKEQNSFLMDKLEQIGCKVANISERMAVVETRQNERLERERAQGIRK
jgi:hypothetical protein